MGANALVWPQQFSWGKASVATTPVVEAALCSGAAVAIGVSDGKDSCATAFAVIESTFSFQDRQWLCDIAPQVLDETTRGRAENAKQRAARRTAAEQQIPSHLLYEQGWPRVMPTLKEAALLALIRREVGKLVEFPVLYTEPDSILARFAELITAQGRRGRERRPSSTA